MKNSIYFFGVALCLLATTNLLGQSSAVEWSRDGNIDTTKNHKLGTFYTSPVDFYTDSQLRMTLSDGGFLGIGTTAPKAYLHIDPPTSQEALFIGNGNQELTRRNNSIIFSEVNSGVGDNGIRWLDANGGMASAMYGASTGEGSFVSDFFMSTNGHFRFLSGTNFIHETMRLTDEGRLGVGTKTPGNVVEIDADSTGKSGLRFTQLTSLTTLSSGATNFNKDRVLSVNDSGDVILIELQPNTGTGKSSGKRANEIDSKVEDLKASLEEMRAEIEVLRSCLTQLGSCEAEHGKDVLHQNFPNPFERETTIEYELQHPGMVLLEIFDHNGVLQATLINEYRQSGKHSESWDASGLKDGIYIYSLKIDGRDMTKTAIYKTH